MKAARVHWTSSLALWTCGLWFGVLVFLGYGVAGTLFHFIDSRTLAGELNGAILKRMNHLEWGFAITLLAISGLALWRRVDRWRIGQGLLAAVALILLYCYSGPITREMEIAKSVVQNFDHPIELDQRPERARFDVLHKWYSNLVKANLMVILGLSILVACGKDEA